MSARPPHLPRRLHPRRRTLLRLLGPSAATARVLNVSVDGMYVDLPDNLPLDQLALTLPGCDGPVKVNVCRAWRRGPGMAVQFAIADAPARRALTAHVNYQREADRVRAMEPRLGTIAHNLRPVAEDTGLPPMLRALRGADGRFSLWIGDADRPLDVRLTSVDRRTARLQAVAPRDRAPSPFQEAVLVVPHGGTFWLADTFVDAVHGGEISLVIPERLFVPERRLGDRDPVTGVHLLGPDGLDAEVLDVDPNGLRVRLPSAATDMESIHHLLDARLVGGPRDQQLGPLKLAWWRADGAGVLAGFSREIPRAPFRTRQEPAILPTPTRFQGIADTIGFGLHSALRQIGLQKAPRPNVWVIEHDDGRPVVALQDATFPLDRPPSGVLHVALIPPAYGRRKEHPAALAATLVATFRAANQPLLVLRWDGVDHVGESWVDEQSRGPDHAMLRYTQTQAVADLALVARRVAERFAANERKVAAVSLSLSAVAVRRYLADGGPGVDFWIAPMGATDARDTIRSGAGGLDIVGARKQGAALGVQLIQGHLVDADHHVDDLIQNGFADLDDARRDFARIKQPVVWIVGTHDYWVNRHRVEDAMSVPAPGEREVIEVPTGHHLRHSGEALGTFRLVAERILEALSGASRKGVIPPAWQLRAQTVAERTRIQETPFDAVDYWRAYLVGREGNRLGFDLLTLTDEYMALLDDEVHMLGAQPGWHVADLGCGTGNLLAELVASPVGPTLHLDGVDFVNEALDRARSKLAEIAATRGAGPARLRWHRADLRLETMANLPFGDASLDGVVLGLILPYLPDPERLLREVRRVLRPGGRIVASTMLPDADMSGPVRRLREKIERGDQQLLEGWDAQELLSALRAYINDAAALLEGEVQGRFRFFCEGELSALLVRAGFIVEETRPTFGAPPLALVVAGRRPDA